MIEMIKRLIRSFKREKNWKERTSDAPKTFPVLQESLIEKVLSMESHAELIDGNIVITEKTSPAHNIAVHKIANALMSFKDNRNLDFEVFTDNVALYCNELHGDDKNFFLPDVMAICDRKGIREDGIHVVPTFVAEVTSKESKPVDFNQKMFVYVDIGVQEYWVVDLQRKRIVRYLLEDPFYPEEFLYSDIKKMNVQAFPGLEIDLAGIFEDDFD